MSEEKPTFGQNAATVPPRDTILRSFMPELDSLRGVAALAVLFYHGLYYSGGGTNLYQGAARWVVAAAEPGFLGVNLFFVLSGFLITGILLNIKCNQHYYANFYTRRALRILPAYYLLLLLLFVYGIRGAFLGMSAVYLSNMVGLFGIKASYGPLWSLSVEEHFYLIWPAVVRKFTTGNLIVVAASTLFICPILQWQWLRMGRAEEASVLTWLVCDGIAIGALIAIFLRSRLGTRRNALLAAAAVCFVAFLLFGAGGQFGLGSEAQFVLQREAWNLLFGSLLISSLLLGSSRWQRVASPRLLRFFGSISYGLYLIHLLVFMAYQSVFKPKLGDFHALLTEFAICSMTAISLATLSRYTYEEYFLRLKERLAPTSPRMQQARAAVTP